MRRAILVLVLLVLLPGILACPCEENKTLVQNTQSIASNVQNATTGDSSTSNLVTGTAGGQSLPAGGLTSDPVPTTVVSMPATPVHVPCVVSEETYKEVKILLEEKIKLEAAGMIEEAQQLKEKIEEKKKEASSTKCAATNVMPKVVPKLTNVETGGEIGGYYKKKISEVIANNETTDKKITTLKQIRNEIDKLIEELIRKKNKITTEEFKDVAEQIQVTPNTIQVDSVSFSTTEKSVVANINNQNVTIAPSATSVSVESGGQTVQAPQITLKNEKMTMNDHQINVLPSEVRDRVAANIKSMELKEENNVAVYKVNTEEDRKIFWLIPVKVNKEITMDATNNGNVLNEEAPWWAVLTSK
jgi:hypothetical protein